MDEIIDFLRRRDVSDDVIEMFRCEKIDCEVVANMSDDDLKIYLPAYGDRVALYAFSRARSANQSTDSRHSTEGEGLPNVVQRVRDKLMDKKRSHSGDDVARRRKKPTNKNATKSTRRIEFGWLCFDHTSSKFHQVRTQQGGGTRHLNIVKETTMAEIKQIGVELFFPSGTSRKGCAESFTFEIRDFSESPVSSDDTVEEVYNRTKVKMLRLYLCSTSKHANDSCSDTADIPKRSDVMDSAHTRQLTPDEFTEMTSDDYLPDLTSCENQNQYIAPEGNNMESCLAGTSASAASDRTSSYDTYISLLCNDSDSDDERLQSVLLDSYHQEESVPPTNSPSKNELQRCLTDLLKQFTIEYFAGSNDETCTVIVQRRNFTQSVMRAISKPGFNFHKRVRIVFSGEEAEDQGGPSREFFTLLLQAISFEMGLFEGHRDARVLTHNVELLRRDQYTLAGKMIAWSIANGGPGLGCISSYMYDLWCGSGIVNVEGAAEHVYDDKCQCLVKEILAVQSESEFESAKMKWSEVLLASGILNVHALHLGDKYTLVEDLLCNYLHFRLSAELTAFSSGLGMLWNVVKVNKDVLKALFVYDNSPLTLLQLRQLYCIEWAENATRKRASQEDTIYYFESFLQDCEDNTSDIALAQVLVFWTGAKSEPPLGFPAPSVSDEWNTSGRPLTISFFDDQGRLPFSSTCSLRLWLPINVGQDQFNNLFKRSLTECIGFGKV